MDGLHPQEFIDSLSVEKNREKVFMAGEGAGASGSFFFFSYDNRFIIKTIGAQEKNILLNMLDDYIDHIQKTGNRSLLARIYGVFTIKTNIFAPMEVIVMQNTVQTQSPNSEKLTFDLKGSTIHRYTHVKEQDFINQSRVLKDLNFMEINKAMNYTLLQIHSSTKSTLQSILDLDSTFLKNHYLMDYSLLLVVES